MSFTKEYLSLNDNEKSFLLAMAINDDKSALKYFEKNSKFQNIVQYSIDNRIEHHLYKFLIANNLLNEIENKSILAIKGSIEIRTKKSLTIYQKALKILNEFTLKKINYVSLKGISYLKYSKTFDRPIRDIDVLIKADDIEKSVDIAFENGFRFKNHNKFSKNMIINSSDVYDLPDLIDENNVCLEIHYKILRDSNTSTCRLSEALFENVKDFPIHGANIKTSCISSCISHLIYHASKKSNFDVGLGSVFDLKSLSRFASKEDLKEVMRISDDCGYGKESESFLNIIQKQGISHQKNTFLLKELIFSPNVNLKVQEFFFKESILQKFKHIFKLLFVSKHHIKREFQSENRFFGGGYFLRWMRQINQFGHYAYIVIFKGKVLKKRAEQMKKFYKD